MRSLIDSLADPAALAASFVSALAAAPDAPMVQLHLDLDGTVDPLAWLQGQTETRQWFWTSRKRVFQMAALGAVRSWSDLQTLEQDLQGLDPALRCYGGWRFEPSASESPWLDWPVSRFILPRWELRIEQTVAGLQSRLCLNLAGPRASWEAQLREAIAMLKPPARLPEYLPELGPLQHQPGPERWAEGIAHAKASFDAGEFRKLVLSRISHGQLTELPLILMQRLLAQGREAYHFWLRPDPHQILWGASPERLYSRVGTTLWTEALAGTRPRPEDPELREALRQELLSSHKEFEENERVREHLEAALEPLSLRLSAEPLRVIPAGPVQHLYRRLNAELKAGITDAQLIQALHPTPAVSGFPSQLARERLRGLEGHDRGWYSGALGWISPERSEWAVILRCALWQRETIHFFTGAGIMPESDPHAEWQELDVKLASLLALFREK